MKEYKRNILWLDYFNSSLTREQGRRIPLDRSVKDPKLNELVEAAKNLGYNPEPAVVKHPKRMSLSSGMVSVEKREGLKKSGILFQVAKALSDVRGKKAAETLASQKPQKPTHEHKRR